MSRPNLRKHLAAFTAALLLALLAWPCVLRANTASFMRVFHVDAGRKYFSCAQLEALVDVCAESGYTHMELVVGNDGLRLLLDDMAIRTPQASYASDAVKEAIHAGNVAYGGDVGTSDHRELGQSEAEQIVAYASSKGVGIIPLFNTPGHMNALVSAMGELGIESPGFDGAKSTVDLGNEEAVEFTLALIEKYAAFFSRLGCTHFNMGADEYALEKGGFQALIDSGGYGSFIDYLNGLAAIARGHGMVPMAFNDGIYYNNVMPEGHAIDTGILVAYWHNGYAGYPLRSAKNLAADGFKILNTNRRWYYVLGKGYGKNGQYFQSMGSVQNVPCTYVEGSGSMAVEGCMVCMWCDQPANPFSDVEAEKVKALLTTFARCNPDYFAVKQSALKRLGGSNAAGTMRLIAKEGFEHADTVVIASAATFKDALCASSLAGLHDAPVLITGRDKLYAQTRIAIGELGAAKAIVVGGPLAVSDAVVAELASAGIAQVDRVAGSNAAATARSVAKAVGNRTGTFIVATSRDYADALAIASWAYAAKAPILLTEANGSFSAASLDLARSLGFGQALIVGGSAAVSEDVEQQLAGAGFAVTRLWGSNAVRTSAAVAKWTLARGFSRATVGVATRRGYKDAITATALLGRRRAALLLVSGDDPVAARVFLSGKAHQVGMAYIFGGTLAVSQPAEDALRATL